MIYVNGDSHSAGAEIISNICFANDDPKYLAYGRRAHPEAVLQTFGYRVSQALNQGFFCEAESGSSNARILRTSKHFVDTTKNTENIFLLIGWTSWEREEWLNGEDFVQVTASGTDSVPEHMVEDYKQWTSLQTTEEKNRKEKFWHDQIYDFHMHLMDKRIKHLFFNSYDYFATVQDHKNWHDKFYNPYSLEGTYYDYCLQVGMQPSENQHYGAPGHSAWFAEIFPYIGCQYNTKDQLTIPKKRSIVTKVKQQFKGFN